MTYIEDTLSARSVMNVTPVFYIEIEPWVSASILIRVNCVVYICTRSVRSYEYMCNTKHAFFYIHLKPLNQSKFCGALIHNISDAPICVLGDKDIETKLNFRHSLRIVFGGLCTVEYVYKKTPCK